MVDPDTDTDNDSDALRVRTLFISDVHLGTTGCQATLLLEFMRRYDADTIYLVGDIVDGWRLRSNWYWPQAQNDVVQKLLRKVRKGARLIYIPGNHDEFLRDYLGVSFGSIEIAGRAIHRGADGNDYLVLHGDEFDVVVAHARWLAFLGDWAYEVALWSNGIVNRVRRRMGLPYWSLSAWAKLKVKNAVNYIGNFEAFLASEAAQNSATGVICGHIHHAADRPIDGVRYMNCGDWVESCTALVEDYDGTFRIIRFAEDLRREANEPSAPQPQATPVSRAA
ncbi:UDP-2,3-diacylglucosamine hydrolase [Rhabdaerophilaceae bacterium]